MVCYVVSRCSVYMFILLPFATLFVFCIQFIGMNGKILAPRPVSHRNRKRYILQRLAAYRNKWLGFILCNLKEDLWMLITGYQFSSRFTHFNKKKHVLRLMRRWYSFLNDHSSLISKHFKSIFNIVSIWVSSILNLVQ